jgi:hypothetical protein
VPVNSSVVPQSLLMWLNTRLLSAVYFNGKYQETKRNASIELTKKVSAILLYWGGLRGMTSDHLLSALSIATPFNLHLQAIRICGRCIITDHRLVSVGLLPQEGGGAELGMCAPDFSFFVGLLYCQAHSTFCALQERTVRLALNERRYIVMYWCKT